jgi:hypothetical protein
MIFNHDELIGGVFYVCQQEKCDFHFILKAVNYEKVTKNEELGVAEQDKNDGIT